MLLAIDTSSPTTLVGVSSGTGGSVLATRESDGTGGHERVVAVLIRQALVDAGIDVSDLTGIVCGVGPGPFTGLRVGIMSAVTFGRALGIAVTGVCSLDIIAVQAAREISPSDAFAVATDARRREVYWAKYSAAGRRSDGPFVGPPIDVARELSGLAVAGSGPVMYPESFPKSMQPGRATARGLAALVVDFGGDVLPPVPLYLRDPDAAVPGVRKRVTQ